jgi:hypothetical protein
VRTRTTPTLPIVANCEGSGRRSMASGILAGSGSLLLLAAAAAVAGGTGQQQRRDAGPAAVLPAAADGAAGPSCGGSAGPGACRVSSPSVPNTDSYYVAVFATQADAAPAGGAAPHLLTLTRTLNSSSAVVSGLAPGRKYWFRWRSHNASNPTLARGWRDYGPPFACTAGPANGQSSSMAAHHGSAPLQPPQYDGVATAAAASRTKFMYVYRVSEYTDEVDFLTNHNSASEAGQAGFLTNTDSSLFFSFNTTAISRYCVEYLPLPSTLPDPGKDPDDSPDFAAYVSCNGPEGRRWGNVPEDPICICDVWSDRMIAHEKATTINASCRQRELWSSSSTQPRIFEFDHCG